VADDADPNDDGAGTIVRESEIDERKSGGPDDGHEQAVRPGKIVEVERIVTGEARDDADVFPSEEEEEGPKEVEKNWSGEQNR
jgi:hypothetical protein